MNVCLSFKSLCTGHRRLHLWWWGCFFSFRIAECFLQLIFFVANLEVFATTEEMKQCPLDQLVSSI